MEYRQLLSIMLDDMTQEQLAHELQTTQATISRWLKGQEPRGTALERIRKLAREKRLAQDATISGSSDAAILDFLKPGSPIMRATSLAQNTPMTKSEQNAETTANSHTLPPDKSGDIANFNIQAGMGNGGFLSVQLSENGQVIDPSDSDGFWSFPDQVKAGWRQINQTYAMQVTGDSMEPTLTNGAYVFVDTSHNYPSPADLYAVDYGHGLMIKRVELLPDNQIRIISDNERYSNFEFHVRDVDIYGRVVASFEFR